MSTRIPNKPDCWGEGPIKVSSITQILIKIPPLMGHNGLNRPRGVVDKLKSAPGGVFAMEVRRGDLVIRSNLILFVFLPFLDFFKISLTF